MRSAFRKGGLAAAVVACLFLAVLLAWRGGALSKKSADSSAKATSTQTTVKQAGGTMADTSVRRLGTVEVGTIEATELKEEKIEPMPIVLWAGDQPAAVLVARGIRNETLGYVSQSFERVEGHGGPFPITHRVAYHLWDRDPDVYSQRTYTADINGDGKDELVLLREHGGVEVYGLEKALFKLGIEKTFSPQSVHRARAGGKDVLYILFEFGGDEKSAPPERTAVLRVDSRGITRLPLGDAVLRQGKVLAVGAMNRPGSQAIDEVLVLSSQKDNHVYLSRHQPDGAPIDTPRKVYVPISAASTFEFAFVPQSKRAIAVSDAGEQIYFIEADKPVNWIRSVDLMSIDPPRRPKFLQAVDVATDPRAIVFGDKALYAVNQEGIFFTWNGGFVPSKKVEPFLRITPPGPDFTQAPHVLVQENGGEEILVVHSREHRLREPPFEEVLKAAERFLDPEYVAQEKFDLEPTLANRDPVRDQDIEEEMKRKGIVQKPRTVEEWKRLLPQSYEKTAEDNRLSFVRGVLGQMELANESKGLLQARNPDELKSWLAALKVPVETRFVLFRRGVQVGSFRVPGFLNRASGPGIEFRARGNTATVVLVLEPKGDSAGERAALFLVHWNGER